jgi:hypothetical protein
VAADARKAPRSRVHLRVSYRRDEHVVEKFAENLSVGGLFVNHAEDLAVGEMLQIEIELPMHGVFRVNADVKHVISGGAGLQLKAPPAAFATVLAAYLKRLEGRVGAKVFVDGDPWRRLLTEAGYRVLPLPPPTDLVAVVGDAKTVGLLAPPEHVEAYKSALAFLGQDRSLVLAVDDQLPVEPVLVWLDEHLLGNTSMTPAES